MDRYFTLLWLTCASAAGRSENGLSREPLLTCTDNAASLFFETRLPFVGRVYANRLAGDTRCSRSFAENANETRFSVDVQHDNCNMLKQRTRGIVESTIFSVAIVISFHKAFVTKADRSYRLVCVYRSNRRLTNELAVGDVPIAYLLSTGGSPTCAYSIRRGSPDGALARYAAVGDLLFHVWECDDDRFGSIIRNCSVDDGLGRSFPLLDNNGCSIDPFVLDDITYERSANRAFVATSAFKFSKTASLRFACSIDLCNIRSRQCEGVTPPRCRRSRRKKSAAEFDRDDLSKTDFFRSKHGFDLVYQLDVLDLAVFDPPQSFRYLSGDESNKSKAKSSKFIF